MIVIYICFFHEKNIRMLKHKLFVDILELVNTDRCNTQCVNSPDICGGDGGFMSVYGGDTMAPGTPKNLYFNVEMNTQVNTPTW